MLHVFYRNVGQEFTHLCKKALISHAGCNLFRSIAGLERYGQNGHLLYIFQCCGLQAPLIIQGKALCSTSIGGQAWVNQSKLNCRSSRNVLATCRPYRLKLGMTLEDFSKHCWNTEIWESAHGLKYSDFSLTEVYTEPNFVYSSFLWAVIKYRDSNISVGLKCCLTESS